jgi:HSP20 family protein
MVEKTNSPAWWPGFAEPFRHMGERIADWFAPRAEAKASDAHYEITMELPGVSESDIDITLHEGVLTVKGEKHSERKEEGEGYFFSEREYGRFQRTFRRRKGRQGGGGLLERRVEGHRAEAGRAEGEGEEDQGECSVK